MTLADLSTLADIIPKKLPPEILAVAMDLGRAADERSKAAALVGGVVRDLILERRIREADVMLESPSDPVVEAVAKARNARLVSHPRFLTHTLHFPSGLKIDVVTAREETYPAPAQLPEVKPAYIERDLKRRDFTINALACRLNKLSFGIIVDPHFGRADINKQLIRALHAKSFEDDPTRIYRAARFAGRFGFEVEVDTLQWIRTAVENRLPELLSPVRRRHEFEMVMKEEDPLPALALLERWGALAMVHPEWKLMKPHGQTMGPRRDKLSGDDLLVVRMADWLRPWGRAAAQTMLNDLQFERDVKKAILQFLP